MSSRSRGRRRSSLQISASSLPLTPLSFQLPPTISEDAEPLPPPIPQESNYGDGDGEESDGEASYTDQEEEDFFYALKAGEKALVEATLEQHPTIIEAEVG